MPRSRADLPLQEWSLGPWGSAHWVERPIRLLPCVSHQAGNLPLFHLQAFFGDVLPPLNDYEKGSVWFIFKSLKTMNLCLESRVEVTGGGCSESLAAGRLSRQSAQTREERQSQAGPVVFARRGLSGKGELTSGSRSVRAIDFVKASKSDHIK